MNENNYVVVFDLFGTVLIDQKNDWKKSIEYLKNNILVNTSMDNIFEVTEEFRIKYMSNRAVTHKEAKMLNQLKLLKDRIGFKTSMDIDDIEYNTFKAARKNIVADGLIDLIKYLNEKKYLLFIMSNTIYSSKTIRRYLAEFELDDYFSNVFTSSDYGYRKPSQKFYSEVHKVIKNKTKISKKDVLFIGNDFQKDVLGSKLFGFTPFWLSKDNSGFEESISRCIRVSGFYEFKSFIINNYIYISGIQNQYSTSDGPGNRLVVYLQGCDIGCDECHNRETWDINKGKRFRVDDLTILIMTKLSRYIKNVTISGGEPLYQPYSLSTLLAQLSKAGLNICLYTSYDFDEVNQNVKDRLDYLKTGKYISKLKDTTKGFYGSTNQKMWEKTEGDRWLEMKLK